MAANCGTRRHVMAHYHPPNVPLDHDRDHAGEARSLSNSVEKTGGIIQSIAGDPQPMLMVCRH